MDQLAKIEGDEIVIRVKIDSLEHGLRYSQYGQNYEATSGAQFNVIDPEGFAVDVLGWMLNEREDGSNFITDMVDEASREAIEQGSEYVELVDVE